MCSAQINQQKGHSRVLFIDSISLLRIIVPSGHVINDHFDLYVSVQNKIRLPVRFLIESKVCSTR